MISSLSGFEVGAALIVLVATFSFLNSWLFKAQPTVALVVMGALASVLIILADMATPESHFIEDLEDFLGKVDFRQTFLNGMLSFLLFAGALHVDLSEVRKNQWAVLVLSTLGVLMSTILVGAGLWLVTTAVGAPTPLLYCMAFGALISPTDPVAVLAIMRRAGVPAQIEATVAGESLFNDGVAIALFTVLMTDAANGGHFSLGHAAELFFIEGGGGIALGLVTGWVAFRAMHAIDDYRVELMISIALVMGGYALALRLGVSGPIAVATAGLLIGNHGVAHAMSDTVRDYMLKFWEVLDDILNAILFLLIGLFSITLIKDVRFIVIGLATIPVVLAARAISVGVALPLWPKSLPFPIAFPALVWGGLRGGISIALVLSMPEGPVRDVLMAATYIVVLFSVLAQGSTLARLLRRLKRGVRQSL